MLGLGATTVTVVGSTFLLWRSDFVPSDANNLELLIRSHEVKDEGYEIEPGGRVVTVFSAPNYCDQFGNKGAYAMLDDMAAPTYHSFAHVPHPKVPPMAYASPMMMS
eukprot:COSAG05_NODE_1873_length_3917_cov_3.587742_2_plen_107_part_00